MTDEQILSIIVTVILVVIILKVFKKVLKVVLVVAVIVGGLIAFEVVTPEQLLDVKTLVEENKDIIEDLRDLADMSDSIRLVNSEETGLISDISVKVNDAWVQLSSVESIVSINDGVCTIRVAGTEYRIDDKNVVKVIQLIYDTRFTTSGIENLKEALGR